MVDWRSVSLLKREEDIGKLKSEDGTEKPEFSAPNENGVESGRDPTLILTSTAPPPTGCN